MAATPATVATTRNETGINNGFHGLNGLKRY
jgi:hypothetical protein